MRTDDFLRHLRHERASAIIRAQDARVAKAAMDTAVEAGFRIIEFTLTTPDAFGLIRDFAARPGLIVGAGTVLTEKDAEGAVTAGASFLVSPVVDPAVIRKAGQLDVPMIPGTFTPTEMLLAHRSGAPLVKLFPGPEGGPRYVRSILAPLPFLRIFPTNGVHLNNAAAYLRHGSFAVGFTNALFDPAELAAGDVSRVGERGAKLLHEIRAFRHQSGDQ
ncbi:MAG: bifunctional 4-hydroxy-2-oxoglutarate aldolase/2-dehydro-3-deoxy-phosphogluconate aldolase [Phycisphaeraceae bacterium]|nr:bifunctional 4-hydroxy-2-oxoglutarate aldolase/2-dehydro-3-deoxy-phosphogluconate aldolase [Phycisphaeraceae bacterium]